MNRLAPIEFVRGFVATLLLSLIFGWIGIVMSLVCGLFFMFGGTFHKAIRRVGIPGYIFGCSYFLLPVTPYCYIKYAISALLMFGILCLGDGYPDRRVSTADEGSWLGRQVEGWFNVLDPEIGGELTKWIVVVLFQISFIPYFWQ